MHDSERLERIRQLDGGHFPVLVIGGGINGAGVFRDLSLNGVECLLIEKLDFCSGSSAAPSRLIHGGLRYLENGEFRLVAESTYERNLLLKNASHVVKPLPTTVPVTTWMSGLLPATLRFLHLSNSTGARGIGIVKVGLMIYDWLGRRDKVLPSHYVLGRASSLERIPLLRPDIVATATYYDARVTHPERLGFEVVSDGLAACVNVQAFNYVSVAEQVDGKLILQDEFSGERVSVTADVVCNAAGPWIDKVNAVLGRETNYIGGSKGSHVVLRNETLRQALDGRMIYFETDDGRICLAYAIGDKVLLGTTDLRIEDPDDARCEDEEIDYLFDGLRDVMPSVDLDRNQIVYLYSGVRPLPNSDAATVGKVTRDHAIEIDEPDAIFGKPVLSLVGGKWTTFRAFGEKVTDDILARLGSVRKVSTDNLAIGGGNFERSEGEEIDGLATKHKLSKSVVAELFARYGNVAELYEFVARAGGNRPLSSISGYFEGEISYLAAVEKVVHLSDLFLRRTTIALNGHATRNALNEVSKIVAQSAGWDETRRESEIAALTTELIREHGVVFVDT